jgi:hypothetical protein
MALERTGVGMECLGEMGLAVLGMRSRISL